MARTASAFDFNPHEREARDGIHYFFAYPFDDFNPHEREARDFQRSGRCEAKDLF